MTEIYFVEVKDKEIIEVSAAVCIYTYHGFREFSVGDNTIILIIVEPVRNFNGDIMSISKLKSLLDER